MAEVGCKTGAKSASQWSKEVEMRARMIEFPEELITTEPG